MDVRLPNLGEGADSGSVVSVAVKEGDTVSAGQTLIELETGKAVAGIPSPSAGKVTKIAVKAGDKLSVGGMILSLDAAGAGASAPAAPKADAAKTAAAPKAKAKAKAAPAPDPVEEEEEAVDGEEADFDFDESVAAKAGFPPPASPTIRRLAQDLGIDLRRIQGSEEGGRIVMGDLKAYIARLRSAAAKPKAASGKAAAATPEKVDFGKWGSILKKPMSPLRQAIAKKMTESRTSIPEVTQFDEADITALNDMRKKHAAAYEKAGTRLTLTSFALRVVANTLKKFPNFNSSLDEAANEIILKEYVHIGLAVDTEAGLLVPVIRDADKKSILDLSKDVASFAEKARDRKVSLEEMQGGTFTISNQGGIGGAHFTPVINRPEVAILGLGRGTVKPVVRDGKIEQRLMMPIAIAYDHRVIDGGEAARFCVELVKGFENFNEGDLKV